MNSTFQPSRGLSGRAAGYARGTSISVDQQVARIDEAIGHLGLVDTGLRMATTDGRATEITMAVFDSLLERAGSDFDVLVIADITRLGRSIDAIRSKVRALKARGADVMTVCGADLGDEWGARMALLAADIYASEHSQRVRAGLRAKALRAE